MRDNNADVATAGSFLVPCAEARAVRRPRIRSWPPASPVRPPGTGLPAARASRRAGGPPANRQAAGHRPVSPGRRRGRQPGCPRRAAAGTGSVRRPWNTSLLGLGRPRALGISPPLASRITWLLFDIAEQRFTQHKPGGRLRQGAARRLLRAPAASCAPSCALPLRRTPADRPRRRDHARAACAARRRPGPGRPKGRRRALGAPQQWQRKRRSRGGGQRRGQRAAGRSCHNLTDVRRC
jgi:hypothetical protein